MKWLRIRHTPDLAEKPAPPRVGLALGGGAVRGAAHLGVLSVLEREGVGIDVVAGTSVGAAIGACLAAGVSSSDMWEQFRRLRWKDIARPSWHSKLGMLDANPLGDLLSCVTRSTTFDQLQVPLAVVSTDILTGSTVVLTEGLLGEAIVASSAIPAIFEPVRRDGQLLIDGGLTDNLPVDAARRLGAQYVIAVDIAPELDGTYEPTDMRDILLLSWNLMQAEDAARADADLLIAPDVVGISLSDFGQAQRAYDAGVQAAEKALPRLRADLGLEEAVPTGAPAT